MTCLKCHKEMLYMGTWPALDAACKLFHRYKCLECKTCSAEAVQ